jgi:hypothetical protein
MWPLLFFVPYLCKLLEFPFSIEVLNRLGRCILSTNRGVKTEHSASMIIDIERCTEEKKKKKSVNSLNALYYLL